MKIKWNYSGDGRVAVVNNSTIVATVTPNRSMPKRYFAKGCMSEWEDTPLGDYPTEREAMKACRVWIQDQQ